jgi:hypothetical protein
MNNDEIQKLVAERDALLAAGRNLLIAYDDNILLWASPDKRVEVVALMTAMQQAVLNSERYGVR